MDNIWRVKTEFKRSKHSEKEIVFCYVVQGGKKESDLD